MEFTKEEIKAATKILQKHVPNKYPLFNNWVNAMQDYAKWYHEQQVKSVDLDDVVKLNCNSFVVKANDTVCNRCGLPPWEHV